MSSSRYLAITARRAGLPATRLWLNPQAPFTTSARRDSGKEDKLHVDAEHRNSEVEYHKRDSISKAKQGKGEWKEELASSSESIVKAEKGDIKVTADTMKKLQEESVSAAKNK